MPFPSQTRILIIPSSCKPSSKTFESDKQATHQWTIQQ